MLVITKKSILIKRNKIIIEIILKIIFGVNLYVFYYLTKIREYHKFL